MNSTPNHTTVIALNKWLIAVLSVVFSLGTVAFWALDFPVDLLTWGSTLLVSSTLLGAALGYRSQKLDKARLGPIAYPVSWRIGCLWLILAGTVEFVLTRPMDVSYTVDKLSPLVFFSTFVTALAFTGGWLGRRMLQGVRTLTRREKLQLAGVILAALALVTSLARGGPERLPDLEKPQTDLPATTSD